MTNGHPDGVVARVALHRGGAFTRRDAQRAGLTGKQIAHRLRTGQWRQLLPGVYAPAGTATTPEVWGCAALAWAGTSSVLSHRSAAEVWRLDGVRTPTPEITVAGTRRPRSRLVTVHRTLDLAAADIARVRGLRVTSPTRTVVDLAAVLDASALRVAFESARRQRLTTVDRVRDRLGDIGGPGRPGAAQLDALLTALENRAPSEYPLEVKVAEILECSRLPRAVPQFEVFVAGETYRLDFAWPAQRVALECDGRERHFEDTDFQRDRGRWSGLAADGWRLLFVTWRDAHHRAALIVERLQRALTA